MRVEEILNIEDNKKIYKDYPHFPAHLMIEDEDNVPHLVLGVRGDGKTFNMQVQAIEWFNNCKKNRIFEEQVGVVLPTKNDIEQVMRSKGYFDKLLSEEETRDKYNWFINELTYEGEDWIYHNGVPFLRFFSKNQHAKYKSQDHSKIGLVWEDEFTKETYLPNDGFKTLDLISTIKRKKKNFTSIFTGNAISLNHPLFVYLGIYEIDMDNIITKIYSDNGILIAKVWNWKRPYEDILKQNNNDAWMEIFEQSGYADYAFKNEFKNDNMLYVKNLSNEIDEMDYIGTYKVSEGNYASLYSFKIKESIIHQYYIKICKDEELISKINVALNQNWVEDGVAYSYPVIRRIITKMLHGTLWYESVMVKQELWRTLRHKFAL